MKEYTEEDLYKNFKVNSIGMKFAYVTVLPEPEDKALESHAGRKGTLKFRIENEKRIFHSFIREF